MVQMALESENPSFIGDLYALFLVYTLTEVLHVGVKKSLKELTIKLSNRSIGKYITLQIPQIA
jgi:hypothetical protein